MPPFLTMKPVQPGLTDWEEMTEFLCRVHKTTKSMLQQLDRSRVVIDKLHKDCDEVARKNAENLSKLRECADMVICVVLSLGLEPGMSEEVGPMPSADLPTPSRTKKTTLEAFVSAVKKNLNIVTEELQMRDDSRKRTEAMLNNMIRNVHERRAALVRHTDMLPREGKVNKYNMGVLPLRGHQARGDTLESKVEELAEQMLGYVRQESQVTHKVALSKLQQRNSHGKLGQADKDRKHSRKEVTGKDKECLKQVEDMIETVHARRMKLQAATRSTSRPRRRPAKKTSVTAESNTAQRLGDLNNEVRLYMDLEMDQARRLQSDLLKKRQEYDLELRQSQNLNNELGKRLRQSQKEKDKYKELYEQEKAIDNNNKKPQTEARQVAASSERRGILKRHHQQQLQQQEENRLELPKVRRRRLVKPKLTPRARHLFSEVAVQRRRPQ